MTTNPQLAQLIEKLEGCGQHGTYVTGFDREAAAEILAPLVEAQERCTKAETKWDELLGRLDAAEEQLRTLREEMRQLRDAIVEFEQCDRDYAMGRITHAEYMGAYSNLQAVKKRVNHDDAALTTPTNAPKGTTT